jgi:hypothetical protein
VSDLGGVAVFGGVANDDGQAVALAQRCVIASFFKSVFKNITKDFNFAQFHYQFNNWLKNDYFSIINYITTRFKKKNK